MKKLLFVALVLFFAVSLAPAANAQVGNTSQQGSVLIYPKVDASVGRDTFIFISNNDDEEVYVKCYWVDAAQQVRDTLFKLTGNQPIVFNAETGKGFNPLDPLVTISPFKPPLGPVGELKCWASNSEGDEQINYNHLTGSAKVIDYRRGFSYEYNAWIFRALVGAEGASVGVPGVILLNGAEYEACPGFLKANFLAAGAVLNTAPAIQVLDNDVTLVPCYQDLRQDRLPTYTKAEFYVWNENESFFSGAYQCMKCWFEGFLSRQLTQGKEIFTYDYLGTTAARFMVTGVKSTVCLPVASQMATPLVGVVTEFLRFGNRVVTSASTGFGHEAGPGTILWDIQP